MTFNIEKAVERIGWRIKEKHWKCNQNDLDAYNFIVDYVEKQQEMIANANELFAKLYIHTYCQYLMKYNASPDAQIPKKKLNEEISKPIPQLLFEFWTLTNDTAFIKKAEKDIDSITKDDLELYDYDFVVDNLTKQINEVIHKFTEWKK